jgi:cysteine desulfurase
MIYLDHNATTEPAPEVVDAMLHTLRTCWANPSSPHEPGQQARRTLVQARTRVAQALGCKPAEVIFTSGATEANHLALHGLLQAAQATHAGRRRVLISAIEHAGLLRQGAALASQGVVVDTIPVLPDGMPDLAAAQAMLGPDVAVVSLMAANNETGLLMPVFDLADLARQAGARLHVDATQWVGKLPMHFAEWEVDALSFSAHKFHGPKGVGALLLRQGVALQPQWPGSQERNRRAGTENLPAIVGMATALDALASPAEGDQDTFLGAQAQRIATLRDALEDGLLQAFAPGTVQVWGKGLPRLPGTSLLRVGELSADAVLQRLARLGVVAASGAACSSGGTEPSHVLRAMGVPRAQALAAVRLSLGRATTADHVAAVVAGLPPLLRPLISPSTRS